MLSAPRAACTSSAQHLQDQVAPLACGPFQQPHHPHLSFRQDVFSDSDPPSFPLVITGNPLGSPGPSPPIHPSAKSPFPQKVTDGQVQGVGMRTSLGILVPTTQVGACIV